MREITIDSMEKLNDLIYDHPFNISISRNRDLYIYRGVSDANYSLITSLQRICKGKRNDIEMSILNNFSKYAELEDASIKDSVWRKMMLGQHHGLSTRLLDWSKSPLIALHFATTESNMDDMDRHDCAVYRLDVEKLHSTLPEAYRSEMTKSNQKIFTIEMLNRVCGSLEQYDSDMKNNNMVIVEPPSMDERMMNQYSFFSIIPAGVETAEEILRYHDDAVCKFVISRKLRWQIRDILDMSNVNERVVYPGLDGIATWISRHYYVRDAGRLHIEKEDIANLDAEAIVNSADEELKCSGNISKRIFERAGHDELTKECKAIGRCEIGHIAVTKGYNLKARYIIHAVAPKKNGCYEDGDKATELLRSVYRYSLKWIKDNKIEHIGFPLLAGGFKGFGKAEAWRIGLEECKRFLKENEGYPYDITFCALDEASYICGQNILNAINGESYRYPELNNNERGRQ